MRFEKRGERYMRTGVTTGGRGIRQEEVGMELREHHDQHTHNGGSCTQLRKMTRKPRMPRQWSHHTTPDDAYATIAMPLKEIWVSTLIPKRPVHR